MVFCVMQASAQDPQFSQFYSSNLYLNPAFTGANACGRVNLAYRNQWLGINNIYNTQLLSYDHFVPHLRSGFGGMITRDKAGSGGLTTTNYSFLYGHEIVLSRKVAVRGGLQGTYGRRTIYYKDFIFGDQISRNSMVTVEDPKGAVGYFDASAGLLLYTVEGWFGFSTHHLLQPNTALVGGTLQAGWNFQPKESNGILSEQDKYTVAINYKAQGKFDQLDIGAYITRKEIVLGLWYRGIPVLKSYKPGYPNNDAVAILLGYVKDKISIGYSYDLTISWLTPATLGSHEVTLTYQFCRKPPPRKKPTTFACPKF